MKVHLDSTGAVVCSIEVSAAEVTEWGPTRTRAFFAGIAAALEAAGVGAEAATPRPAGLSRRGALPPPMLDRFDRFLAERCEVAPEHSVPSKDLYAAYLRWCAESPGVLDALTRREFGLLLAGQGFVRGKAGHDRRWHWGGLRPRP